MLLEELEERGVRATFFRLGKEVEKYPDIVKDICDGEHLIGTHSYEHVNLSDLSDKAAIEQVDKTSAEIKKITGNHRNISGCRSGAGNVISIMRRVWLRCSGMWIRWTGK